MGTDAVGADQFNVSQADVKSSKERFVAFKRERARFVPYLEILTRQRKARWVRSERDKGYVYCKVGDEIIEFQASDGSVDPADVDGEVGGIICTCRSSSWLWLTTLDDGQQLLRLLRSAKVDSVKFDHWHAMAHKSALRMLRCAMKKKNG